jgi:hypothetical protein
MPGFWPHRSAPDRDIKPGDRYRRRLDGHLAATATVLGLRADFAGIPHVHFAVSVASPLEQRERSTRVLALRSFLDTYRERVPAA